MKIEIPDKVDFSVAKVGDRVIDIRRGEGKIYEITNDKLYPITVLIDSADAYVYTNLGKFVFDDKFPTLFYLNDKGDIVTERPKKMVEKVMTQGVTAKWGEIGSIVSISPWFYVPAGTFYKIVMEVEE